MSFRCPKCQQPVRGPDEHYVSSVGHLTDPDDAIRPYWTCQVQVDEFAGDRIHPDFGRYVRGELSQDEYADSLAARVEEATAPTELDIAVGELLLERDVEAGTLVKPETITATGIDFAADHYIFVTAPLPDVIEALRQAALHTATPAGFMLTSGDPVRVYPAHVRLVREVEIQRPD